MIPTNPADELENLIPNRRSVELFFSKGVYLKGFSMNGHQFPVASILLKNKNKTLKTSGDLGDLRVKDVTPTTESLMEDDSFLFGAWARPGSNQRCGDSKIPHGHLGATDFPRFNYLEALARLEVGKPVGKMCVIFLGCCCCCCCCCCCSNCACHLRTSKEPVCRGFDFKQDTYQHAFRQSQDLTHASTNEHVWGRRVCHAWSSDQRLQTNSGSSQMFSWWRDGRWTRWVFPKIGVPPNHPFW